MSAIPSSRIGNYLVYIASKNPAGNQQIVDETREFVIALENLLEEKKKTVGPQVAQYVFASFAHSLKGQKTWPGP
jgi:hypothetical protein